MTQNQIKLTEVQQRRSQEFDLGGYKC